MIKFNKSIFEIEDTRDKYKHFLVFLIRKFYGNNFNGTFNRINFINTGIDKYGYKKKTIEQIFDKGIKNNCFILKSYIKRNKKYYVLKSNINKVSDSLIIGIEERLLNKIYFMSDFYTFCFVVISSFPDNKHFFTKFNDTKFNKITGRTLEEIGRSFGSMPKNGVHYHIEKGKKLFKGFYNVIGRTIPFKSLEVSIASLYYLDAVNFSFIKTFENGKQKSKLYKSKFIYNLVDLSDFEIKKLYGVNIKTKNGIRDIKYKFGSDIDFGNQFFNKDGRFLYEEFYNNYHQNMKLIIGQY